MGDGKRAQRGAAQDNDIEIAITRALASLQNTSHLTSLISKTNDYGQTLAHFAVIFGYINLLRQLVEWGIDLSIADMNGLTALHCAYKKGDRVSVQLLLENGASETVLDNLGRAPRHLMSGSSDDHDTSMSSDDKSELRELPDSISLSQRNDLGHETIDEDDGISVDGPDRGFREWVDQMENHTPVESPSKAAASGPMGRVQYTPGQSTFRLSDISSDPDLNSVLAKESGIKEDRLDPACVTPKFSRPSVDAHPVLSQDGHFSARHKSTPVEVKHHSYATIMVLPASQVLGLTPHRQVDSGPRRILAPPIDSLSITDPTTHEIVAGFLVASWRLNQIEEPAYAGKSCYFQLIDELTMVCRLCGKQERRAERLVSHLRQHFDHRPYSCSGQCGNAEW